MAIFEKVPYWVLLLGIVLILVLDQWSKGVASSHLQYGRPLEFLPFLNWTLLHNFGAAFSFLSDQGGWQRWFFTAVSSIVSMIFLIWMLRLPSKDYLMRFCLMFIVAGALGNLYDRVTLGYVVDFISVHWQSKYFFPAFNVADMSITFGAMLMILEMIIHPEKK